jgi:hypothetical protein
MLTDDAEYLGCSEAAFEWADSYDSKDWDRLRKCIAPTLRVCPPPNPLHEDTEPEH